MGKTFENLTWDDLCDLMCGSPEDDEEEDFDSDDDIYNVGWEHKYSSENGISGRQDDNRNIQGH